MEKKMYIIIHNPAEVDATISVFSTKDEYNEAVREAEENAQVAWDEDTPSIPRIRVCSRRG